MPTLSLPISPEEQQDLQLLTFSAFKRKYGWGTGRYYGALKRLGLPKLTDYVQLGRVSSLLATDGVVANLPRPDGTRVPRPVVLRDVDVVVAGDFHVPFHDPEMIALFVAVAQRDGIRTLLINGDFFDQEGLYAGDDPSPGTVSFDAELQAARGVVDVLFKYFDQIVWNEGNHDDRITRSTHRHLTIDHLGYLVAAKYGENFRVTPRDHVELHWTGRPDDSWRVTHGDGSRSMKSSVNGPKEMAEIYNTNVIQGHNHAVGRSQTKDGRHWGVSHGCIVDPRLVAYKQVNTTTHSQWVQGFGTIRRGKYRQYTRNGDDWEIELNGDHFGDQEGRR